MVIREVRLSMSLNVIAKCGHILKNGIEGVSWWASLRHCVSGCEHNNGSDID